MVCDTVLTAQPRQALGIHKALPSHRQMAVLTPSPRASIRHRAEGAQHTLNLSCRPTKGPMASVGIVLSLLAVSETNLKSCQGNSFTVHFSGPRTLIPQTAVSWWVPVCRILPTPLFQTTRTRTEIQNALEKGRGLGPGPSLLLNELKSEWKGPLATGLGRQSPGWHRGLLEVGIL